MLMKHVRVRIFFIFTNNINNINTKFDMIYFFFRKCWYVQKVSLMMSHTIFGQCNFSWNLIAITDLKLN